MAGHQAIHSVITEPVIHVSRTEILSVFRCAASLADHERMHGTADRLRHDADLIDRLTDQHARVQIVIHS